MTFIDLGLERLFVISDHNVKFSSKLGKSVVNRWLSLTTESYIIDYWAVL